MSEKSLPKLLTGESFQGMYSRHGFTQAEKGANLVLNDALLSALTKLTAQATLQAENDGHSGLNGKHARKAIEATPEIPKGVY